MGAGPLVSLRLCEFRPDVKHMFERVSTLPGHIDIVQVFDEHLYDTRGEETDMSAIPVVPGSVAPKRPKREVGLRAVPDLPVADVRDIRTAPSAVRRRQALRAEDPAARRRPAPPRSSVDPRARSSARTAPLLRVVGGALLALAGLGVGVGVGLLAQPDPYSGPTVAHSVVAGDSVWGLAAAVGSERPLEQVVLDIEQLNHIGGTIQPGQILELPAR